MTCHVQLDTSTAKQANSMDENPRIQLQCDKKTAVIPIKDWSPMTAGPIFSFSHILSGMTRNAVVHVVIECLYSCSEGLPMKSYRR